MPNSAATRSADSRVRFATLTISTPGIAFSPGRCRSRVFAPAPTIPTRIVSTDAFPLLFMARLSVGHSDSIRSESAAKPERATSLDTRGANVFCY